MAGKPVFARSNMERLTYEEAIAKFAPQATASVAVDGVMISLA